MAKYANMAKQLEERLAQLTGRAETIEEDLRGPLDADWSEQAVDLADDESLEGVDTVLRAEIHQVRQALGRIADGNYGVCVTCGKDIGEARLTARPIATQCIKCAEA